MTTLKNPRQERFCLEYVLTGNATQSAITAGYSAKTANNSIMQLLVNTGISKRITELRVPAEAKAQSAKERKLKILDKIYNREPLPKDISARDRVWAIAEHNKMMGDYAPEKHAVVGDILIEVVYKEGEDGTDG